MVDIAAAVEVGKHLDGLLPAILLGEPTRRAGKEEHADEENGAGNHLDAPGNTEGSSALVGGLGATIGEGGTVLDEVLDQDTPGRIVRSGRWTVSSKGRDLPSDGPLLERHDTTTDFLGGNLGLVDGNNGGGDTNGQTGDNTANTEHGDAIAGGLEDGANDPDQSGDLDGSATRVLVGNEGGREGADERTSRHGGSDATLAVGGGVVEVVLVGIGAEDTTHGRDIETEQTSTEGGEAAV